MYGQLDRIRAEQKAQIEEDRRYVRELLRDPERMREFLKLLEFEASELIDLEVKEIR